METTSICLNNRLRGKNFKIHINLIEINVNICLLYAHNVTKSIIVHTRRTNSQYSQLGAWFYVSADFIFRILRSSKSRFSHRPISTKELSTNGIYVVGGQ